MKYRIIVAALVEKDGTYLFGRKAKGIGPFPDKWLIPGGGVDLEHETLEEGLRRELREEAGIEITEIKRTLFKDQVQEKNGERVYHIFLDFVAVYASGEPKAGDDLVELLWVEKDELKDLEIAEVTKDLLQHEGLL